MLPPGPRARGRPSRVASPGRVRWCGLEDVAEHERHGRTRDAVEDGGTRRSATPSAAHLVSDVPLGVLLSGGVDSTLVASLARRHGVEPHFLTVGFADPRFDEVATARATALRLGGRTSRRPARGPRRARAPAGRARGDGSADRRRREHVRHHAGGRRARHQGARVGARRATSSSAATRRSGRRRCSRRTRGVWRRSRDSSAGSASATSRSGARSRARDVGDLRTAYLLQRALGADVPDDGRCGLPADTWDGLAATASDVGVSRRVARWRSAFYLRSQLLHDADVFSLGELRRAARAVPRRRGAAARVAAARRRAPRARRRAEESAEGAPPSARAEPSDRPREDGLRLSRGRRGCAVRSASTWRRRSRIATRTSGSGSIRRTAAGLLTAFARHDPRVGWAQLWSRFVLVEWYRRVALDVAMPTAARREVRA